MKVTRRWQKVSRRKAEDLEKVSEGSGSYGFRKREVNDLQEVSEGYRKVAKYQQKESGGSGEGQKS